MSKELLKRALENLAFARESDTDHWGMYTDTIENIEAELAKPAPEPIFYGSKSAAHGGFLPCEKEFKGDSLWSPAVPLYESPPDYEAIKSELNAMNENCKGLIEERRKFKDKLFEARQVLLKEGMRADALQARIDSGVRVGVYEGDFGVSVTFTENKLCRKFNALLIIDDTA